MAQKSLLGVREKLIKFVCAGTEHHCVEWFNFAAPCLFCDGPSAY